MNVQECTSLVTIKTSELLNIQSEVGLDELLSEYGLDSVKTIRLLVELEEIFQIYYKDEELLFENFKTIRTIVEKLMYKISE